MKKPILLEQDNLCQFVIFLPTKGVFLKGFCVTVHSRSMEKTNLYFSIRRNHI